MYRPCQFDREDYLQYADKFETNTFDDVETELSQFNDDLEDMAYELAYTRYQLAKAELRTIKPDEAAIIFNKEDYLLNMPHHEPEDEVTQYEYEAFLIFYLLQNGKLFDLMLEQSQELLELQKESV